MVGNSQHTEERPFVSSYFLPSSTEDERERLDWLNRYMTRIVFEGKLIRVPTALDPGDEVLDSAAGTGIWLLDVSREVHPNVSLIGIDINPRFFPTQHPENVTFAVHSVTNLPDSWSDRFKVANQRLLTAALTCEQWEIALKELYRVLKPGGWVQLMETSPDTTLYSGPKMKRMVEAVVVLYANNGLALDLHESIDQRLEDVGFVNVHKQTFGLPRQDSQDLDFEHTGHKKIVLGFIAAAKQGLLSTGLFESGGEFDVVLQGMDKEWDVPSQCFWRWTVAYGQKPDI